MWSQWNKSGLEHLHLANCGNEIIADGIVLGVEDDVPFRLRYQVRCDLQWRVRGVTVNFLDDAQGIILSTDGEGHWFDESGKTVATIDGCLDVDISATPFTNTLPIRRLALQQGESSDLKVAYIAIPEMQVSLDEQRYTCLDISSTDSRYRYESLDSEFKADLVVDADGLVADYPELFRRVWSS